MLYRKRPHAKVPVSLARSTTPSTSYRCRLARQFSVDDGNQDLFRPNVSAHHTLPENSHELVDIPDPHLVLQKMPEVPEGYEIARVDMVVPAAPEAL